MIILSLESIAKQFADRPLLDGITFAVEAGERVGVVGVNGSGKTTLLRIAAGAETPDSGRVSWARDLRLAYLPQNPALDGQLTVIEQIFRGDTSEMQLLRDYERAAEAGSGPAALLLGATFDPVMFGHVGAPDRITDPAQALAWYRRARDLGMVEAEQRIKRFETPSRHERDTPSH